MVKSYNDFAVWANFACLWSCIWKGLHAACGAGLFFFFLTRSYQEFSLTPCFLARRDSTAASRAASTQATKRPTSRGTRQAKRSAQCKIFTYRLDHVLCGKWVNRWCMNVPSQMFSGLRQETVMPRLLYRALHKKVAQPAPG